MKIYMVKRRHIQKECSDSTPAYSAVLLHFHGCQCVGVTVKKCPTLMHRSMILKRYYKVIASSSMFPWWPPPSSK
jgi:hypothetical protein